VILVQENQEKVICATIHVIMQEIVQNQKKKQSNGLEYIIVGQLDHAKEDIIHIK
jgi:hypothetical protein